MTYDVSLTHLTSIGLCHAQVPTRVQMEEQQPTVKLGVQVDQPTAQQMDRIRKYQVINFRQPLNQRKEHDERLNC
jgi:hypothetical protein